MSERQVLAMGAFCRPLPADVVRVGSLTRGVKNLVRRAAHASATELADDGSMSTNHRLN